jgi:rubrerythrin
MNIFAKLCVRLHGGEEIFTENITSNIKFTSSSPPGGNEEEAPVVQTKEQLKKVFAGINPLLVFNAAFYPKAAGFLAAQGFSNEYLSWLHEFCLSHKPKNLAGFYFKLFFSEQAVELYRLAEKERSPPLKLSCPVCGLEHDRLGRFDRCPSCGLKNGASPEEITEYKMYRRLPDDQKTAFDRAVAGIQESSLDFRKKLECLTRLRRQFGFL